MPETPKFCCAMRRHFLTGIVGHLNEEAPVDVVDFLRSFEGPKILCIRFCPFCGTKLDENQPLRQLVTQ